MTTLTDDEVHAGLAEGLAGWEFDGTAIHKEFAFGGFRSAIDFIQRVADVATEARHHPDLSNHYNRVGVSLSTHSEGGVTAADLALARAIEAVAETEE
jgi:4a-hydroxytetrahydrobiopterin dehydratase